jgi:hypothetical protein
MDFLNLLGCITFFLTAIAMYLVGVPSIWCFGFFCVAQTLQIIIFYKTRQWWLIAQMVFLIAFNIVNHIKWAMNGIG